MKPETGSISRHRQNRSDMVVLVGRATDALAGAPHDRPTTVATSTRLARHLADSICACLSTLGRVATQTANLHAAARKEMVNAFLLHRFRQTAFRGLSPERTTSIKVGGRLRP
jgi:hypothetical protein